MKKNKGEIRQGYPADILNEPVSIADEVGSKI